MQTLEPATEEFLSLNDDSPCRAAVWRDRQRHSSFIPTSRAPNVIFIGAERRDEFAHALHLAHQDHHVIAINPRETFTATRFRRAERNFPRR